MIRIQRAIILAAGRGERLRPYTDKVPKPLLPVDSVPIIEHTIKNLRKHFIYEIYVVTGYKHEMFEYLKQKYFVDIIYNDNWDKASNLASLKCAASHIENCIILDGDLIIRYNAIRKEVRGSGYSYVDRNTTTEWAIHFKRANNIDYIDDTNNFKFNVHALYSFSYWVGKTAKQLQQAIISAQDNVRYADDIMIKMPCLHGYRVNSHDLIEIDTVEDYKRVAKIR